MTLPSLAGLGDILTLNGAFDWNIVGRFLFQHDILQGVVLTVIISVIAQLAGTLIGILLYFIRRSPVAPVRWFSEFYVWIFRGTPVLVQLLFLYALFPVFGLARPLIQTHFFANIGFNPEVPVDTFVIACIALALNEGAYMAEIVRSGIDSIDTGQLEAAKSLGMTYGLAMRRIVLPQAMRVIIPPLGNEFNNMLKTTSIASVISLRELLGTAQTKAAPLGAPLEMLFVASVWFLLLTTIWGIVQAYLERRFNAQNLDPALRDQKSFLERVIGFGGRKGGTSAAPVDVAGH